MKITKSVKFKYSHGFSLIELLIVIVIVGILASMAVPYLLKAKRASNEASAIASVRLITRSQIIYRYSSANNSYATIDQLHAARHLDETLGAAPYNKHGYAFSVDLIAAAGDLPARFNVQANPTIHVLTNNITGTGVRNFGSNETGSIYETRDNTLVTFDNDTRVVQGTALPVAN